MVNYTQLVNKNCPVIVQIGAHDGILGEEYGLQDLLDSLDDFKLVLVEPVDKFYCNLSNVYGKYGDKVTYVKVAISDMNGSVSMVDSGCMSKIDINGNMVVDSMTWDNFVATYDINRIDLLLLDCEGYEFNILKQINFDYIKPSVIRYEYYWIENKQACDEHLLNQGYNIGLCSFDSTYNKIASI